MRIIAVFVTVLFMFGACQKNKPTPEVTPSLLEKKFELKDVNDVPEKLFACPSGLIFILSKTRIVRFSPQSNAMETLHTLQHELDEGFFFSKNRLVLKRKGAGGFTIIDLKTGEVIDFSVEFPVENIFGLESDLIVLQSGNRLLMMDVSNRKVVHQIDLESEAVRNCEFDSHSLFILTGKKLYHYSLKSKKLDSTPLDAEAASGFLLWGNHIYYGSKNRELVRYSLNQHKVIWKIKLPMNLLLRPEKSGRYIMAAPEDNNIYFFQKNATLYWWEKCNSTRLAAPVVMRENVAVFLMNNRVRFFNFKDKTVQDFQLKNPALSSPAYLRDYLYFMSRATRPKGKAFSFIEKLGNQYHVRIKTEPEYIKPAGQSVQVTLSPINVIKPEMDVKILNSKQENMFNASFKKGDLPTFVWIPEKEGKYRMVLHVVAENMKDLNIEKEFTVIDLNAIVHEFGRTAIERCLMGRLK